MDSKVLIAHCNDAGVHVKSSALASITPDERDQVLAYLKTLESEKTAEPDTDAPVREERTSDLKKIRAIKTATSGKSKKEDDAAAPDNSESANGTEVGDPQEQETSESEESTDSSDDRPDSIEPTGSDESQPAESIDSLRPDDYVPASGGGRRVSNIREMSPRSNLQERGEKPTRPKSKPKPKPSVALPNLAAPPVLKTDTTKKDKKDKEPAAQKPDIVFSSDILNSSAPLRDILEVQKKDEQKRKKGRGKDDAKDGPRERPMVGGGPLSNVRDRRSRRSRDSDGDDRRPSRMSTGTRSRKKNRGPIEYKSEADIEIPISVRAFAEALGRKQNEIMKILFQSGHMLTINDMLDEELALEVAMELGVELHVQEEETVEDVLENRMKMEEVDEGELAPRPPIVTVLGHVDHGKTTLVDRIRSSNVVAGEAGGITQHIAAYQVEHDGQKVTFVDTPGHAAFGEMRARGANVTDIIVLVVAADDGVMPQTEECISHAKAAGVPIVVAMNKIDLPDVNEQRVLQELSAHEILPSEWGGDVEVVRTSALEGIGIDELLETINLTAELHEYKADFDRPAHGVCLEAFRDEGRGPLAWLIVQQGTLRVGDIVLCGPSFGRIRAMYNDRDEELTEAGPSMPVKVAGLDTVPGAGDHFFIMEDIEEAREIAEKRQHKGRTEVLATRGGPKTLETILSQDGSTKELPLILKADTPGSIEALRSEIEKFEHDEVKTRILHEAVGGVNESDIYLASASGAVIVAFHVIAEDRAMALAEKEGVEIRRYSIIYEVTKDIRDALEGMLAPEKVEVATGRAIVLRTFDISRFGRIAGCRVLNGTIERNSRIHVIRDQTILNNYPIASLKREKDDAKEVREGMECGIRLDGFNDVKEGDLLEAFRIDEIKRTLDGK